MINKFVHLSNLFLAFVALAPSQSGARLARGGDLQSQSSNQSVSHVNVFNRDPTYNNDWAGATCIAQPGINFDIITATFKVPTITSTVGIGDSGAFVWVGIGHQDCGPVLVAGMEFVIKDNVVRYNAAFLLTSIKVEYRRITYPIFPGDEIKLTVGATNVLGGVMVVENRTPDRAWAIPMQYASYQPICDTTAHWVVQNSVANNADGSTSYAPFANFQTISFYDIVASGPGSFPCFPPKENLLDIKRGGTDLTESSIDGKTLKVRYLSSG